MTQVLNPPDSPFSTGSLRRNNAPPSLFIDTSSTTPRSGADPLDRRYSNSLSSSAPSSPRLITHDLSSFPSCASTPSSSLSLSDPFFTEKDDDELQFPSYDDADDSDSILNDSEKKTYNSPPKPASSPREPPERRHASSRVENLYKTLQSVGDDLSIKDQPSRHVDYFSHDWKEEELLSSWRHVVGKRGELENWERLENTAWRTWSKSRNQLPVVPPQNLNWMKDHDVTWLYGPLQPCRIHKSGATSPIYSSRLSRNGLFANKKSILKKRSLSEVMLRRSLSTSTLVRQAVDFIVSQEGTNDAPTRPVLSPRAFSDFGRIGRTPTSNAAGTPLGPHSASSSSGAQTPSERRHIHFSEKVEQCIAINEDADEQEDDGDIGMPLESDEESDDGILMMRTERGKERKLSSRSSTPRPSFGSDDKQRIIARLPSTTLRRDTPEPPQSLPAPKLVKTSSQETLKPSRPSANFLIDEDEDADLNWQPNSSSFDHPSTGDEEEELRLKGLRRTPSGMFMPDDDEEDYTGSGLFGRVINTVNTARDIAHVIWNVGWRG